MLARIDRDRDGAISTKEATAYTDLLERDLIVRLDQQNVELKLAGSGLPKSAEIRTGLGIIQLEFTATPNALSAGAHRLILENRHLPNVSVYLFNAAKPNSALNPDHHPKRNQNRRNRDASIQSDA